MIIRIKGWTTKNTEMQENVYYLGSITNKSEAARFLGKDNIKHVDYRVEITDMKKKK
jgi:hypothetical protein